MVLSSWTMVGWKTSSLYADAEPRCSTLEASCSSPFGQDGSFRVTGRATHADLRNTEHPEPLRDPRCGPRIGVLGCERIAHWRRKPPNERAFPAAGMVPPSWRWSSTYFIRCHSTPPVNGQAGHQSRGCLRRECEEGFGSHSLMSLRGTTPSFAPITAKWQGPASSPFGR
jgi:hypothetical protein